MKLTVGQAHDERYAADMFYQVLLADHAYYSDALHQQRAMRGIIANVWLMPTRKSFHGFDPELYHKRNKVESFFSKINWLQAVTPRYDKRADLLT